MTTLSVCTMTDRSAATAAEILEPWRAVADEIVVALDDRVGNEGMDSLRRIADRIIRWEYEVPLEKNLAPLHASCRGDWVLRVDGDEVPSAALLRRLEQREWARDVTHLYLPRRWLWTQPTLMLDDSPWRPDFQLRLLRNMPGLIRFPTLDHELPQVAGPGRFLREPLYHLDMLIADEQHRRRKAAAYDGRRPGMSTEDGHPQNLGFYVPEARITAPPLVPVADEDVGVLEGITAAFLGDRPSSDLDVADIERMTIAERHPHAPAPGEAAVKVLHAGPREWIGRGRATVTIEVTNHGERTWDPQERWPVRVGAHLRSADGAMRIAEMRADLPCAIRPGETELVPLRVAPLPPEGGHVLSVGVVREQIGWFDTSDEVTVTIAARQRIVVGAGISAHRHLGDDLILRTGLQAITDAVPGAELVVLSEDPPDTTERFGATAVYGSDPIVHPDGPAPDRATALTRIDDLRSDALAFASGDEISDQRHAPLIHLLGDADALVLFGAGWASSRYWRDQLLPRLAEVEVARALGVPVLFESATIGPFEPRDRETASRLLRACRRITVRDRAHSPDVLSDLGVEEVEVVADVATTARGAADSERDAWLRDEGIEGPWAVIGLRSREDVAAEKDGGDVFTKVAQCIVALAEAGITPVFVPHVVADDVDDLTEAEALAAETPLHVPGRPVPDEVAVALIRRSAITVGNRFHLALLADASGVAGIHLVSTDFDRQRASALSTMTIIDAEADEDVAVAVHEALGRGVGSPGARWDGDTFASALREVLAGLKPEGHRGDGR